MVIATELVYPFGLVKPDLLPGDVLIRGPTDETDGVVQVWLQTAQLAVPDNDAAQRAYVYGRYYRAVADRLASEYSSETMGRESRSRSNYQVEHFQDLALAQELEYAALTLPGEATGENGNPTHALKTRVVF